MANSRYDEALKKQKRGKGFKAFKHTQKKDQKVQGYFTAGKEREIWEKKENSSFLLTIKLKSFHLPKRKEKELSFYLGREFGRHKE